MTVQPIETDTLIDIAALVGEMEAPGCESRGHPIQGDVHGGPSSHYARVCCPACGWLAVRAYCEPFVQYIAANGSIRCSQCRISYLSTGNITILGPVNL